MPIVGEASREGWAIVEGVWLSTFGELDLGLESVDFSPSLQYSLFFL